MALVAVNVTLILDLTDREAVADAVNEILREQQRDFSVGSCLMDYHVPSVCIPLKRVPSKDYCEGSAFEPI